MSLTPIKPNKPIRYATMFIAAYPLAMAMSFVANYVGE
jgi:hypothetical protein